MKKLIKILTSAVIAAALTLTCVISAFAADTSDYVSKEKIIEELWGQYWDTNDTDPTEFPESSWDYYIVTGWLDRNYGNYELVDKIPNSSFCDWSKLSDIRSKYRDFYENLTENWDFDDDDGNWYINEYDPETEKVGSRLYHFNFNQGQWSMIDENGDTVYSFPPKTSYVEKENNNDDDFHYDVGQYVIDPDTGELVEKENDTKVTTTNKTASADDKDNSNQAAQEGSEDNATQGGARVTGKTENTPAVTSSDSSSESKITSSVDEDTESGTSPIVMVLCIIVIAGIVVIVILYLKRKKDENKK